MRSQGGYESEQSVQFFSRSGRTAGRSSERSSSRNVRLQGLWYVRNGNESPFSKVFDDIIKEAEQDLRDLMHIPDNYKVLFLQGGASQQFAMIPMNLMKNGVADYIVTGQWAKKAYAEAQKYGKVNKIATSEDKTFSYIPIAPICRSARMQTMYISARTIPFMVQNSKHCRIQKARHW